MSAKDTGGSAFPRSPHSGDASDDGMTLRDYFAAKAMQGMSLTSDGAYSPNDRERGRPEVDARWVASAAYRYADAMLAARKEPQ